MKGVLEPAKRVGRQPCDFGIGELNVADFEALEDAVLEPVDGGVVDVVKG